MSYFTCNESKIHESFTFWNKLQEFFFHDILIYWDAPVNVFFFLKYMLDTITGTRRNSYE